MSQPSRRIILTLQMEVSDPDIEVIVRVDKVVILSAHIIIQECCFELGIDYDKVLTATRKAPVVRARFMSIAIMRDYAGLSFPEIGRSLNRDHSSIMYLYKVHGNEMDTNEEYAKAYKRVLRRLKLKFKRNEIETVNQIEQ